MKTKYYILSVIFASFLGAGTVVAGSAPESALNAPELSPELPLQANFEEAPHMPSIIPVTLVNSLAPEMPWKADFNDEIHSVTVSIRDLRPMLPGKADFHDRF
jgi:hypothetical protein